MKLLHGRSDPIAPRSHFHNVGRYGRLFPELPALRGRPDALRAAMLALGDPAGPMAHIDPPRNPRIPTGFTFLGQFIDHDMTFDPTSSLERMNDPEALWNFRTPLLELDSLYGSGPDVHPHLYDQDALRADRVYGRFFLPPERPHDLPRNGQGTALTADPRNDENLIVAQLHRVFLQFHNRVLDSLRPRLSGREAFAEAQRLVRWHYQWLIVHEYLPLVCGQRTVQTLLRSGRKYYFWRAEPFLPVEFSGALFRFGHSEVRNSYPINFHPDILVDPPIFSNAVMDLRGGRSIPESHRIDWSRFFQRGSGQPAKSSKIDTRIAVSLFALPDLPPPASLPQRNLLRGLALGLPAGQAVARRLGVVPLGREHFEDVRNANDDATLALDEQTPLWFYVLREAESKGGRKLGPVGARLVAEVVLGVLEGDRYSYLNMEPGWKPFLGREGCFGFDDFITFAEG